jgi:hypothetical protein
MANNGYLCSDGAPMMPPHALTPGEIARAVSTGQLDNRLDPFSQAPALAMGGTSGFKRSAKKQNGLQDSSSSFSKVSPYLQRKMQHSASLDMSKSGVMKGSTKPFSEVAATRGKISGMMSQLDENNREIEMQKLEIRRLREQVLDFCFEMAKII